MSPGPPESPQEQPAGATTPPRGSERGSNALSPAGGAIPAMWWSPSAREWFHRDPEHGLMAIGAMGSLADSLPKDAQRLVPVGPLLGLLAEMADQASLAREDGDLLLAQGIEDAARMLREHLATDLSGLPGPQGALP